MLFDVHSLMQNPNHIDRVFRFAIEHDVGAHCVPEISIADDARPTGLFTVCRYFHGFDQIVVIVVCLLERPTPDDIASTLFEIEFGQQCELKLPAFNRHASPACGLGRPRCRMAWVLPMPHRPSTLPATRAFAFRVIREAANRLVRRRSQNRIVPTALEHRRIRQSGHPGERMCFAT
jgi:hypothetical protein